MHDLPARWQPLYAFLEVLLAPLVEAAAGPWFLIEANGPDGSQWTSLRPLAVNLDACDPVRAAARATAVLSGATRGRPDPGPDGQRGSGVYYAAAAFVSPRRADANVAALGAVVLDVDDRDHSGRAGVVDALARVPRATAVLHSGGGMQTVYVLREAVVFDRSNERSLRDEVRRYLRVALALQAVTNADDTAWPSHLFRCPGTYHLKNPTRPVLVDVELDADRLFNLSDFDVFAAAVDEADVERHATALVDRLLGRNPRSNVLISIAPVDGTRTDRGEHSTRRSRSCDSRRDGSG